MTKELIVSKYNKDISWLHQINNNININVYRKDGIFNKVSENININTHYIDNIGREMYSYFYHILNNYNNLSDILIFSQDDPFDHVENYIDIINSNTEFFNKNCCMCMEEFWGFHWNSIGTMWDMPISKQFQGKVLVCQSNGLPHADPAIYNLDLNKVWDVLFDCSPPSEYEFIPGAHFIVTKKLIQSRPKTFYQKLLSLLEEEHNMPWTLERLIIYIFDKNIKIK